MVIGTKWSEDSCPRKQSDVKLAHPLYLVFAYVKQMQRHRFLDHSNCSSVAADAIAVMLKLFILYNFNQGRFYGLMSTSSALPAHFVACPSLIG